MDVLRSFPTFDKPYKESLKRILKATAYILHDGANYCQGMNYIAGYFLSLTNGDETKAYYHFLEFIRVYMTQIYTDSFRRLQGYFYVLDSVIKNYLPNVHKNFKVTLAKLIFVMCIIYIYISVCTCTVLYIIILLIYRNSKSNLYFSHLDGSSLSSQTVSNILLYLLYYLKYSIYSCIMVFEVCLKLSL